MHKAGLLFILVALAMAPVSTAAAQGRQGTSVASRLPSKAEARAVCGMIATRGPAIAARLVKDGVLDANNDGVPDAVSVAMREGTMGGEDLAFRPHGAATDAKPVDVAPKGFQPGDYLPFGARWLAYGGRVYTLSFEAEDLRHPSYLGYIDATNAEHLLCDFSSSERESLRPVGRGQAEGLCRAVAQGNASYLAIAQPQDSDAPLDVGRRETSVAGRITIDAVNSGTSMPLALLSYASGRGRGCALDYFDLVEDGKIASSGDLHAILMKLQDVEPDRELTLGPCDGAKARWLVHRGLTFLELAAKGRGYPQSPSHEIKLVRGQRLETWCRGQFTVRWAVHAMGPEFR